MMISGFDYLLQLQLKGCTGEVALPPLVGSKQAIQPQPSNPAEIVGGAMWHAGFVANWHSNMSDNDHLSDQRMIHSCNFMIPAPLFYEVNDPLLQVCCKP